MSVFMVDFSFSVSRVCFRKKVINVFAHCDAQAHTHTMGGPCWLAGPGDRVTRGPDCTDNYQLCRIVYDGDIFHSIEHAFQAIKLMPDGDGAHLETGTDRRAVVALEPRRGETAAAFGERCWEAGQAGRLRPGWDAIKVDVMYRLNKAKVSEDTILSVSV
jgi:hypothetical protein